MALNINTEFPTQSAAADADYPFGSAQNVTTPGDNTGTPWVARLVNDWLGFFQAALSEASATPSGTPDNVNASQYLDALRSIFWTKAGPLLLPNVRTLAGAGPHPSAADDVILRLDSGNLMLRSADVAVGRTIIAFKTSPSNTIGIFTEGSELIGNQASLLLGIAGQEWAGVILWCDGTDWWPIASSGLATINSVTNVT